MTMTMSIVKPSIMPRRRRPLHAVRHQRTPKFSRETFVLHLADHLKKDHYVRHADKAVTQLVCDYVQSLVYGDGSVPAGLPARLIVTVRFRFALGCAFSKTPPEGMAGCQQAWFAQTLEQARRVKQDCADDSKRPARKLAIAAA